MTKTIRISFPFLQTITLLALVAPGVARADALDDPATSATQNIFPGPVGALQDPVYMRATAERWLGVGSSFDDAAPGLTGFGAWKTKPWTLVTALHVDGTTGSSSSRTEDPYQNAITQTAGASHDLTTKLGVGFAMPMGGLTLGGSLRMDYRHAGSTLSGSGLSPAPGANSTYVAAPEDSDGDKIADITSADTGKVVATERYAEVLLGGGPTKGEVRPAGYLWITNYASGEQLAYQHTEETNPTGDGDTTSLTETAQGLSRGNFFGTTNTKATLIGVKGAVELGGAKAGDYDYRIDGGVRYGGLKPTFTTFTASSEDQDGNGTTISYTVGPNKEKKYGNVLDASLRGLKQIGSKNGGKLRAGVQVGFSKYRQFQTGKEDISTESGSGDSVSAKTAGLMVGGFDASYTDEKEPIQTAASVFSFGVPVAVDIPVGDFVQLRGAVVAGYANAGAATAVDAARSESHTGGFGITGQAGASWTGRKGVGAHLVWYPSANNIVDLSRGALFLTWGPKQGKGGEEEEE